MTIKPIPDGYHTITPYLIVEDADKLVEFIEQTFDGQLIFQMRTEAGRISHAEMKIGDSMLMLSEASEEWSAMPTMIHLYVSDTDTVYQKALAYGAVSIKEPQDQFYGDRNASVKDSSGNIWGIATHIEDLSEAEMEQRMSAAS